MPGMSGMAYVIRERAPWRWIACTPDVSDSIEFPKPGQYLPTGLGTGTRLGANPPCTDSAYHFLEWLRKQPIQQHSNVLVG